MANVLGNSAFIRGSGIDQSILDNYLPLNGGKLTGNLFLETSGDYPRFIISNSTTKRGARLELQDSDGSIVISCDDLNNYNSKKSIILFNPETCNNIQDMLSIAIFKPDENLEAWYKIYGEHSITAGTSDLTAGTSYLGSGCIYQVHV